MPILLYPPSHFFVNTFCTNSIKNYSKVLYYNADIHSTKERAVANATALELYEFYKIFEIIVADVF